jgi:hypothetical protein
MNLTLALTGRLATLIVFVLLAALHFSTQKTIAPHIVSENILSSDDQLVTPVADATSVANANRAIQKVPTGNATLLPSGPAGQANAAVVSVTAKPLGERLVSISDNGYGIESIPVGGDKPNNPVLPIKADIVIQTTGDTQPLINPNLSPLAPQEPSPVITIHHSAAVDTNSPVENPAAQNLHSEPEHYFVVSYKGSEGVRLRRSCNADSPGNIIATLVHQTESPLRQIGQTVQVGDLEWINVEVVGWIAIKNQTKSFMKRLPGGECGGVWEVTWNRTRDPLWMRTENHSESTAICGLPRGTVVEGLGNDYSDLDYHYIHGGLSGWVVKSNSKQVLLKEYFDPS